MSLVNIRQAGPLPITSKIMWPSSETVMVAVSGSAYTNSANTPLSVKLTIHGTTIGTIDLFANASGQHMAFPTGFFAVNGVIGDTTIVLSAANGTTITDYNDHFTVALTF